MQIRLLNKHTNESINHPGQCNLISPPPTTSYPSLSLIRPCQAPVEGASLYKHAVKCPVGLIGRMWTNNTETAMQNWMHYAVAYLFPFHSEVFTIKYNLVKQSVDVTVKNKFWLLSKYGESAICLVFY